MLGDACRMTPLGNLALGLGLVGKVRIELLGEWAELISPCIWRGVGRTTMGLLCRRLASMAREFENLRTGCLWPGDSCGVGEFGL